MFHASFYNSKEFIKYKLIGLGKTSEFAVTLIFQLKSKLTVIFSFISKQFFKLVKTYQKISNLKKYPIIK